MLEQLASLRSLRVLVTIESGDPKLNAGAAEFLSRALKGPLELEAGDVSITVSFGWSLAARIAEVLKASGDSVMDFEVDEGGAVIVTRRGYVITIKVEAKNNGYVSEVLGTVDVERAPFEIIDS